MAGSAPPAPVELETAFWIAAATVVGFGLLAFLVLWPFARLIRKQAEEAEHWTPEALARRSRPGPGEGDGAPSETPPPSS